MAITKYDQFDFLIDIVPRDDIKPPKPRDAEVGVVRTGVGAEQVNIHSFTSHTHYVHQGVL